MKQHVLRYWLFYYFGIFVLAIFVLTLGVKKSLAQMYTDQPVPVLGQVQHIPVNFCIVREDAQRLMNAQIAGKGEKAWDKKVAEGKCAMTNVPWLHFKILSEGWVGHVRLYLTELRLKLGQWAPAYAFFAYKPSGMHLVHDTLHYVQAPPDWQKWFGEALTTVESRARLAAQGFTWHSCCNKADRVKTQFRVSENKPYEDEWHYLDPTTQQWVRIPNDIIHYEDDPKMPTQLKIEGVLFVYNGIPTCFWAPQEGG